MDSFVELVDLQEEIGGRIGRLTQWVRVEVESHREVRGHHYLKVLQKLPSGEIVAKADAKLWSSRASILVEFTRVTGREIQAGMSIVVLVTADYHPVYGLSLIINDIDPSYTVGQREIELKRTIAALTAEGLMDRQKTLELPFLPSRIAVISSKDAAGYGDFVKHLAGNARGFKFDCTLLQALMQGDYAPSSIEACLNAVADYDLVLILRGGGADSDLFCYDDYNLCKAIALCGKPVLTAIGHERDRHIADMVANFCFKTPTALADFLVEWVSGVEDEMDETADCIARAASDRIAAEQTLISTLLSNIRFHLSGRVGKLKEEVLRCTSNICFVLNSRLNALDSTVDLTESRIRSADPRAILNQGYVLAVDGKGKVLKTAASASAGDEFALRFKDGLWDCGIRKVSLVNLK